MRSAGWWRAGLGGAGLAVVTVTGAGGADGARPSESIFIAEIVVLILVGRVLGEAMQRIGQPAVMGPLLGGLLLGPSVLGALWPQAQHALFPTGAAQKSMIDGVAQLGVLMLLLLTGMETDLKLVRKVGRAAISVSIAGICIPFLCGFALGQVLPGEVLPSPGNRLIGSLFLGIALSISSVKIVAMVVRQMNFMRRDVGQVIIASAVIDDTIGWIIIAITLSLAGHGGVDASSLVQSILGTALFLAVSLTIGRRLVFGLIRWANDSLVSEAPVIAVIVLVMGGMALVTHLIGVHTVLGAFVAGILIGESPILTRHIDEQLRGLIMGLFMPVFFGLAGLSVDLTILKDPVLLGLTCGLIVIASVGKFAGAFVGGELGGMTRRESLALGCGMNARGSTEVIVATIGLSMGVLSDNLFTMIVTMAVLTTLAMPPMLRWALARLPLGKEEGARLEREAFEAKGFVANLERLLLTVDEGNNGTFASRLTGMIAGPRGIPITVLHVGDGVRRRVDKRGAEASPEAAVKAGALTAVAVEQQADETAPAAVAVTTRVKEAGTREAVADEARKGYDLLVIGLAKTMTSDGGFHREATRAATGFDGPLALVIARGRHLADPTGSGLQILVPINGTEASRRAAEIAIALARASDVPITALYVANTIAGRTGGRRGRAGTATRRHEEAILKDVVALADRAGTPVRTIVRVDLSAEEAILREARGGRHDLIVMGVNRRPADTLFFGNVAVTVVEKARCSILLVAD